jgi:uncharacterized protein (TIRG00374 family)
MTHSRFLNLAFKLAFTVGAFWLALHGVDFIHLTAIIKTQALSGLLVAAGLIVIQIMLGGLRWRMIVNALLETSASKLSMVEAIKLYYISAFFNCCLPGTVGGDVVRVWLAKANHVPLPTSINSVIMDRIIALIALGVLVVIVSSRLGDAAGVDVGIWPLIFLGMGVCGIWFVIRIGAWIASYQHIRPVRWALHFIHSLQLMLVHRRQSFISLLIAITAHSCFCLCAFVLANSLGAALTLLDALTFVPLVMFAITVPVSIGGWGIREVSMVGMLSLAGVPQEAALMISIEIGIMSIVATVPAALLWAVRRRAAMVDITHSGQ